MSAATSGPLDAQIARHGSRIPRVLLFGEWETSNLGDRAILAGASEWLAQAGIEAVPMFFGALRPTVPSQQPPSTRGALTSVARGLRKVGPLLRIARGARARRNVQRLVPLAEDAAAIVVGGGALLDGRDGHFLPSLAALAALARTARRPLFCLGCGRTSDDVPVGREATVLKAFLRTCRFTAVRDPVTAALLEPLAGHALPVFGDFAFRGHLTRARPIGDAVLGVNVMRVEAGARKRYEEMVVTAVRAAAGFSRIVVFTTGDPDDGVIATTLVASMRSATNCTVVLPGSSEELRDVIARCSVIIASRLHAAVLALDEGVRVVDANPDGKIASFFSSLSAEPITDLASEAVGQPITVSTGSRPSPSRVTAITEVRERALSMLATLIVDPPAAGGSAVSET